MTTVDIKFITTTSAKLNTVGVVDGQIIALSDKSAMYYDMNGSRHSLTGNVINTVLPDSGEPDTLYVINNEDSAKSGVYIWSGGSFVKICSLNNDSVKTESSSETKVYLVGSVSSVDGVETLVKNTGVFIDFTTKKSSIIAASADSADKAVADSDGQAINETYIKAISAQKSGSTVTFTITKGDDSTTTFTVEDSDTTYDVFRGVAGSTAGGPGLVPAPSASDANKFLKGDGSWGVPDNTTYEDMKGSSESQAGEAGLVPAPTVSDRSKFLKGDGQWSDVSTDTVGATESSTKLFIVGAQSQSEVVQSHTNQKVYVDNNRLYSNSKQVITTDESQALTNKTYEGYTLGNIVDKTVAESIVINGTDIPTSGVVYTALQGILSDAKGYTDEQIGQIVQFDVQIVSQLPDTGKERTIYLVPSSSESEQNVKTEYMYIEGKWEVIGNTDINLSGYVTTSQMDEAIQQAIAPVVTDLSIVAGKLCITFDDEE